MDSVDAIDTTIIVNECCVMPSRSITSFQFKGSVEFAGSIPKRKDMVLLDVRVASLLATLYDVVGIL